METMPDPPPIEPGRGRLRYDKKRRTIVAEQPALDAKSEIGLTVGLIDSIITTARVLRERLDYDALVTGEKGDHLQPIRDALRDLNDCNDFERMITYGDRKSMQIIHEAAELLKPR